MREPIRETRISMIAKQKSTKRIASQIEYSQIFNRLCHMVALSQKGKVKEAADNLLITALALQGTAKPVTVSDVSNLIQETFKLSLHESLIQASLDRF